MTATAPQAANGIYFDTKVVRSTLAALHARVPVLIHQGGTNSGKTFGIVLALFLYLRDNPEKLVVSVVGVTVPHLIRGAFRDFDTIRGAIRGITSENKTSHIYHVGNSILEFFSADDNNKVRGGKRDILFLNEGNLLPFERYRQLAIRTARTAIIDYNPVGNFWAHDNLIGKPGTVFKRTTYRDNPTTPAKVIREIEAYRETDPQFYRIYGKGLTGQIKGLIFPNVRRVPHFPDDVKNFAYGLDFGYSEGVTALIQAGLFKGEVYGDELIYEAGLDNLDLRDRFKELRIDKKIPIWADAAAPSNIAELRKFGYNVKAARKGPDSIKFGISLLKRRKLNLTFRSVNWWKEATNYKWAEDKDGNPTGRPVDVFNHAWDAARYYGIESLPDLTPRAARFANG
jgi:phage terminase large subunit